jgi:membrane protein
MNISFDNASVYLRRFVGAATRVVLTSVREFSNVRSLEAGAAISFFAFFSLFPVVIFMISILGFFFQPNLVQTEVFRLLRTVFPAVKDDVTRIVQSNLQAVFRVRGSISIIAAIGLLWAGSNVFYFIVTSINKAWGTTESRLNYLRSRLVAFAIMSVFAAIILFSFFSTTLLNLIGRFNLPINPDTLVFGMPLAQFTVVLPFIYSFVLFLAIYKWVPNTHVPWSAAIGGAAGATIAWRLAIVLFVWLIKGGAINYKIVYGSLATVVIIMVWIYISSLILLMGAHLSAAIAWESGKATRARDIT